MSNENKRPIIYLGDDVEDVYVFKMACKEVKLGTPVYSVYRSDQLFIFLSTLKVQPALILIDFYLVGETAPVVVKKLKALDNSLNIIVISSKSDPKIVEAALNAGADSFSRKPASYQELLEMLEVLKNYWIEDTFQFD